MSNFAANPIRLRHLLAFACMAAGVGLTGDIAMSGTAVAVAQSDSMSDTTNDTNTSLASLSLAELEQEYNSAAKRLRSSLKTISISTLHFRAEGSEHSEHWREQWQGAVDAGTDEVTAMHNAAMEIFRRQDKPADEIVDLAFRKSLVHVDEQQLEKALAILKRANQISPTSHSRGFMAGVQLQTNEFAAAADFYRENPDAATAKDYPVTLRSLHASLDELTEKFTREQSLRDQEAEADDLPRVELNTNAGKIVLELFENEAPSTVGNFIHLVENGYYNGVIFHRVRESFMAQAGGFGLAQPNPNVPPQMLPRGVRYTIPDEHELPEARHHFRGTLSMANQNASNTGSSQFFLCLTPQPGLDGRHTVFGRVIEGLDAMSNLVITFTEDDKGKEQPVEAAIPTIIVSAKVIRKRDHDYEPTKVEFSN